MSVRKQRDLTIGTVTMLVVYQFDINIETLSSEGNFRTLAADGRPIVSFTLFPSNQLLFVSYVAANPNVSIYGPDGTLVDPKDNHGVVQVDNGNVVEIIRVNEVDYEIKIMEKAA